MTGTNPGQAQSRREWIIHVLPNDASWIPGCLDRETQERLVAEIRKIVQLAPLYTPVMPRSGKPMSVRMTNCGELGWVTDREGGYRYQKLHPVTGKPWPDMPEMLFELWQAHANHPDPPQSCLVNYYGPGARMGLHQDRDEEDLSAPVLSISLGDTCLFRLGETTRSGRSTSFRLKSGDVVILKGRSRLAYHGVDRIYPDTSTLLRQGGRLNLTLRRVTAV